MKFENLSSTYEKVHSNSNIFLGSSKIILNKSSILPRPKILSSWLNENMVSFHTIIYPLTYFWISKFSLYDRNSLSLYVPRTISVDSELENIIKSTRAFTRGHDSILNDAIFIDPLFPEISSLSLGLY